MTMSEILLWNALKQKKLGYDFDRQRPINEYIVDFYCPKAKLVIEVDGSQHYCGKDKEVDRRRDAFLQSLGFKVLRFSDREVLRQTDAVLEGIYRALTQNPPFSPFKKGGE